MSRSLVLGCLAVALCLVAAASAAADHGLCPYLQCHNGGLLDDMGSCRCHCGGEWTGRTCLTCARDCGKNGELNSATCTCVCDKGFTGPYCTPEKKITVDPRAALATPPPPGADSAVQSLWNEVQNAIVGGNTDSDSPSSGPPTMELEEVQSRMRATLQSMSTEHLASLLRTHSLVKAAVKSAEALEDAKNKDLPKGSCRNQRFLVCKGQAELDSASGKFSIPISTEYKCTRWNKGSRAMRILGLRPGLDEGQYTKNKVLTKLEDMVKLTQIADLSNAGTDGTIQLDSKFAYRMCIINEAEYEEKPATSGSDEVAYIMKCTPPSTRAVLSFELLTLIYASSVEANQIPGKLPGNVSVPWERFMTFSD